MGRIERIEKFFSHVGNICLIVGATVLLIVLGHYALGAANVVENMLVAGGGVDRADARFAAPVYDEIPWKIEYWTEFNKVWGTHFEPYFHYRRDSYAGKFINIDAEGVRRTAKPSGVAGEIKVFMLGGSTMWGTGAPDDKTIPSIIQSLLGDRYDVYNYGESAYVSALELNYLLYQLARGNIPDIVIFYDGINDGYTGAYSPSIPRDHESLRYENTERQKRSLIYELYYRSNYRHLAEYLAPQAGHTAWDEQVAPKIPALSKAVVDVYEAHIKQVKALAQAYGFQAYFFWQPSLFSLTREPFDDYERGVIENSSKVLIESQRQVFLVAKGRFSDREDENIYFLGHVFDQVAEPIYSDWHHVGPNGNAIIAQEMFRRLDLTPWPVTRP